MAERSSRGLLLGGRGAGNGWDQQIGTVVYADFTFWQDINGQTSGWIYLNYTVPDGTTHYFQISRAPYQNYWLVFLDNTQQLMTSNVGFWTGEPMVGGECYCDAPNEHADTFNMGTTFEDTAGQIGPYPASGYEVDPGFQAVDYGTYWSWNAP